MEDLLSFIFSFILDLFDDIAEWTIPPSIKAWYRKRKKITRSILKGILDGVLFIIALVFIFAIACLLLFILSLFGIVGFEG